MNIDKVRYIVIPIFALANAGIPLSGFVDGGTNIFNNITMGVALGLIFGKLIGIAGATWIGWKMGLGNLPTGCNFKHIVGVGFLAGIGFTMSIFIADLGFASQGAFTHAFTAFTGESPRRFAGPREERS